MMDGGGVGRWMMSLASDVTLLLSLSVVCLGVYVNPMCVNI